MGDISTTDAVHHRLDSQQNSFKDFPYQCYDCGQPFQTLEEVAKHSIENQLHSNEICLKCGLSILVFSQEGKTVRIHTCKKSDLSHLACDLSSHSLFLFQKLESLGLFSDPLAIGCDIRSCMASFDCTLEGVFKMLKHANKYKHTTVPYCRKCTLPEFQVRIGGLRTVSHYCVKSGRNIFISKSI